MIGIARGGNCFLYQYSFVTLPQARRLFGLEGLVNYFLVRLVPGIDIDEATVKLPSSIHQAAHDVGWNAEWRNFFAANPNPSITDIVNQTSSMMWEFGLDRYVLGVEPY